MPIKYYHKIILFGCLVSSSAFSAMAQDAFNDLWRDNTLSIEACGTVSSGDFAPLWLASNRQGIVSPYGNSAYERVIYGRSEKADSAREWRRGFCIDVVNYHHAQTALMVHQAYASVGWKKATLTIGKKDREIEFRNNSLTSGGLSLGINAEPIPQAMLDIEDIKLTKWWTMRLRVSYGLTTDGGWQKEWVENTPYKHHTSNYLYHEKAFYWEFGREEKFPVTFDFGMQFMTQFGGRAYNVQSKEGYAGMPTMESPEGIEAFWNALILVGSSDATDGKEKNAAGNTLGSYNMRLTYHGGDNASVDRQEKWNVSLYFERLFEDASNLTAQYGIYDHLLGLELSIHRNRWLSNVLVEHLSTKDQAGAVFFDGSDDMKDRFAGRDDYYNHLFYVGWQNYGMSLGTPLLMSPIYNADHALRFKSNRTQAWHFALAGQPLRDLKWRMMYTQTKDWGTYDIPFDDVVSQKHVFVETSYSPRWMKKMTTTLGFAKSWGGVFGNNTGCQLAVRYNIL